MSAPTSEPTTFFAGDTVTWEKTLADYPASESWVLAYRLRGPANYEISGGVIVASGDNFVVTVPAATTKGWTEGFFTLFGWVTKSAERYEVYESPLVIKPDFASQTGTFDGRSHVKKALTAIEAVLEGSAAREENQYSINFGGRDRQLAFCSKVELIQMRNYYLAEVRREEIADRIKQGKGGGGKILVRFK
jgi:hypothetical protein